MRKIALIILLSAATICHAQTENGKAVVNGTSDGNPNSEAVKPQSAKEQFDAPATAIASPTDSLFIPRHIRNMEWTGEAPTLFTMWKPWMPFGGGGGMWNLHQGLNAEIEAGVIVGFGRNNPFKGGSFFTDISLLYAQPINDRLSYAIGGDVSRFRMWNDDIFNTRIQGMLNYKINDRLDATMYGIHNVPSLSSDRQAFGPLFDRTSAIGAALTWKCTDKATFGISFEHSFANDQMVPLLPPPMQQNNPNNNRR